MTDECIARQLSTAQRSLQDLLLGLASADISPGSGVAGAVALALAAACAGKAVTITLKRESKPEVFAQAQHQLAAIGRRALIAADEDARRFEDFTHAKDAPAATRLIQTGEGLEKLGEALTDILQTIESHIDPVVAGDIAAAQALSTAFRCIVLKNLKENKAAAGSVKGSA